MRMLIGIVALAMLATHSTAATIFTKEYKWDVAAIEKIEMTLEKMLNRQNIGRYAIIPISEYGIGIACEPHFPKEDLSGCSLSGDFVEKDSYAISFIKRLRGKKISTIVKEKLASIDPNETQDHLHFGSLFVEDDGSHYYCQPEKKKSKFEWVCYHFIREEFGTI